MKVGQQVWLCNVVHVPFVVWCFILVSRKRASSPCLCESPCSASGKRAVNQNHERSRKYDENMAIMTETWLKHDWKATDTWLTPDWNVTETWVIMTHDWNVTSNLTLAKPKHDSTRVKCFRHEVQKFRNPMVESAAAPGMCQPGALQT
jgi:hypothetical protein